jgi:hypothetical protein
MRNLDHLLGLVLFLLSGVVAAAQAPTILSIDGHAPGEALAVSKKPVLVGSADFSAGAPTASTWVIGTDPALTNIVAIASTTNSALLTTIAVKPACFTFQNVPANRRELEAATTYYARVQYVAADGSSAWSDTVSFETTPLYVSDPVDVPVLSLPDISQADFQAAFDVLEARIVPDPVGFFGPSTYFRYPFQTPGDAYGYGWWQFDQDAMLAAEKWTGLNFSDDVMRNWFLDQAANGNGHIDEVSFFQGDTDGSTGQPTFFAAARDVAKRASDPGFALDVYDCMKGLYGWFKGCRLNPPTGLVTTGDDEGIIRLAKFVPDNASASVDLNVLLNLAARDLGTLASRLATNDVAYFESETTNGRTAINTYLWNPALGRYGNISAANGDFIDFYDAGTFYPLMGNITGPARTSQLVAALTNSSLFNWNASAGANLFPCTTLAQTDPSYQAYYNPGDPIGYSSSAWLGDVWTVVNFDIVRGLEDSSRASLAAELMHQTLSLVNNDYREWYVPDGTPAGSPRYGWTAANYAQLIIEDLFGIDYDAFSNTITVTPHIPSAYRNALISIGNVNIPTTGDKLSVTISPELSGARTITVSIDNPDSTYNLVMHVPTAYGSVATRLVDAVTREEITHDTASRSFQPVDQDGDGNQEGYLVRTMLSSTNHALVSFKAYSLSLSPPVITAHPQSRTNLMGWGTLLTVSASGTAPLFYQWRWNGTDFPQTTSSSLMAYNAGSYSVSVSNRTGVVTRSQTARLVLTNALPGRFEAITVPGAAAVQLLMSGTPGTNYTLLWSGDWTHWESLGTLASGTGRFQYTDVSTTNRSQRFYRLRLGQ